MNMLGPALAKEKETRLIWEDLTHLQGPPYFRAMIKGEYTDALFVDPIFVVPQEEPY